MLLGKNAIITGASRGIGKAIALLFAENGADLIVGGTNASLLDALCAEVLAMGRQCFPCAGDVADPETAGRLVALAEEQFQKIDVLVNNAGINDRTPTLELTHEAWKRVLDINLNGTFYVSQAVLKHMAAHGGGSIVNMSSTASKTAKSNAAVSYGASKAAVNAMTRQWALEFAPYQIRINAVCPGPVMTDMSSQWTEEYRSNVAKSIPLGRVGAPEEVAALTLFLASDQASFITGQTINVNGGSYME